MSDYWEKVAQEKAEAVKKVKGVLAKHNIRMSVDGCGCCGSPMVKFEYNGEVLLDSDEAVFDQFNDQ